MRLIAVGSLLFLGTFLLTYHFIRKPKSPQPKSPQPLRVFGNTVHSCRCKPLIVFKEPTFHEITRPSDN